MRGSSTGDQRGAVNWLLVTGVTLPLVMVGLFLAAVHVPRWWVGPPEHDLVFSAPGAGATRSGDVQLSYRVVDGRLVVTAERDSDRYRAPERLFRYHADEQTARPIELGQIPESPERVEFVPPALRDAELSDDPTAPDGYRFHSDYRRSANLFGALFGGGGGVRAQVAKNGAAWSVLPDGEARSYWNVTFHGWVLSD